MKVFLTIGGLFTIIVFCIIPLDRDIKEYDTQKYGKLITAIITHIPVCNGTKIKSFMKFTYGGQEFDKKVNCSFADTHKVGQVINLKHSEGTDIFLFENENKEKEFISKGLLAALGAVFIWMGLRKNRNAYCSDRR